uniref:Uncharacterized protein n=1 Tax=Arundo donax TaxID=35708 RepID=A0A0A8Z9F4_ARUDO
MPRVAHFYRGSSPTSNQSTDNFLLLTSQPFPRPERYHLERERCCSKM